MASFGFFYSTPKIIISYIPYNTMNGFLRNHKLTILPFLDTLIVPSMVFLDTKELPLIVILDIIELSLMTILDIIHPTIYGILDTMVRSDTKILPSLDGTMSDLK